MKYLCLGYTDEKKWERMSESERNAFLDSCFAYDDILRAKGHFVAGEALQSSKTATTVRPQDGKPSVTDGPFVETKEQLGGVLILEAKNLDEAIQLISNHPGIATAGFEIRPIADLSAMIRESEKRRGAKASSAPR
ncbi:MAG: YciI family protein [Candidatus Acidiferrum sp.]|jgi:hypothetical protein